MICRVIKVAHNRKAGLATVTFKCKNGSIVIVTAHGEPNKDFAKGTKHSIHFSTPQSDTAVSLILAKAFRR